MTPSKNLRKWWFNMNNKNCEKVSKFINNIKKKENKTVEEKYVLGLQNIFNLLRLEILNSMHGEEYGDINTLNVESLVYETKRLFNELFDVSDIDFMYKKEDNRDIFTVELVEVTNEQKILGTINFKADDYFDALNKAEEYFTDIYDLNVVEGAFFICELNKENESYPSRTLYVESNMMNLLDDIYKVRIVDIN